MLSIYAVRPGFIRLKTGEHTTSELERVKRELSASLALSAPGSQARMLIARHLEAVGAELSRRPGEEG